MIQEITLEEYREKTDRVGSVGMGGIQYCCIGENTYCVACWIPTDIKKDAIYFICDLENLNVVKDMNNYSKESYDAIKTYARRLERLELI